MGKGTIVSHIEAGEYTVTVNYNRGSIDAAIDVLSAELELLQAEIDRKQQIYDSTEVII